MTHTVKQRNIQKKLFYTDFIAPGGAPYHTQNIVDSSQNTLVRNSAVLYDEFELNKISYILTLNTTETNKNKIIVHFVIEVFG